MVRRCRAEWQSEREVRSLVCGSCWVHGQLMVSQLSAQQHDSALRCAALRCVGSRRTWWMISFKTSTGRSSRRSGPRAAFSLPLVACFSGSAVDAPTAWGLGTARWLGQAWSAPRCVASVWPSSGEEGSDCVSSSSEASGDDVLGVPGLGVESGEAMSLSSS